MKAPCYPGGTLRLARLRDQAPPVSPSPVPSQTVPTAALPARPDPAEAAARRDANLRREREAREAAAARRRQQTHEVLALLRARWPEAFAAPVPLATGIIREIREGLGEAHLPAMQLSRALQFWTRGPGYLAAVAVGQRRRHLDGTDAGEPDVAHRQHAREALTERAAWRGQAANAPSTSLPGAQGGSAGHGGTA